MRQLLVERHDFALSRPFVIAGQTFTSSDTVRVSLAEGGHCGRGEASGVIYTGETPDTIIAAIEAVRHEIEAGTGRIELQLLLPSGGARNALDCALWDLEAKQTDSSVWRQAGIEPRPLVTVLTLGIDTPDVMAARAAAARAHPKLKLKLDAETPIERVAAVRAARPDATLIVDVNQAWDMAALVDHAPRLAALGVELIEQPLPRGRDDELIDYQSPVLLGADESCLDLAELPLVWDRYGLINVKLDKCGGLTEALALARAATSAGLEVMVGNMTGTSLAMAPSHVVAQFARFVDLDGPLLLASDILPGLVYRAGGIVEPPERNLWG